jgi:hypothetical protein
MKMNCNVDLTNYKEVWMFYGKFAEQGENSVDQAKIT